MKLTQVEIESFRCFERLNVSLEADVPAIIGVNAAGKTALLDAIAAVLSAMLSEYQADPSSAFRTRVPGWVNTSAHRSIRAVPEALKENDPVLMLPGWSISATAVPADVEPPLPGGHISWKVYLPSAIARDGLKTTRLSPEGSSVSGPELLFPGDGSMPAGSTPIAEGILIIDEIELNLHPKWQQMVIPHLRKVFPNTQLIVATHSPIVFSTLEARQIRILKDQQLYKPPVETYGNEAGRIQRVVMGTETRPPDNPVAQEIEQVYAKINDEALDAAEQLLNALEKKLDSDVPALIEARTLIETRRWEMEIGL